MWFKEREKREESEPKLLPQDTLCFAVRDGEILLAMKKVGFGKGKWNGAGGRVEEGETVQETAKREMEEEFGIIPLELERVAEITFLFPEAPKEEQLDRIVHVFIAREWRGEPVESKEMKPQWFPIEKIPYKKMWSGDYIWLPRVLRGEKITARFSFDKNEQVLEQEIKIGLPLRFYIAGSFSKREEVKLLMNRIEELGHRISLDWTTHLYVKPYEENLELAARYTKEDIEGVRDCDIFVLIPEEEGGTTQFAELGAAIVIEDVKRIFVVGPHNTRSMIFIHPKIERVDSIEEVFIKALPHG